MGLTCFIILTMILGMRFSTLKHPLLDLFRRIAGNNSPNLTTIHLNAILHDLHVLHGSLPSLLSVYSVYSRLLGAPLRGSRSLGFLDFVSLSG